MTNDLEHAQADMRRAYLGGAAGMATSATVWLVAAIVAQAGPVERAVWTLLVGGMLIHPVATLVARLLGRSGAHAKGNPLATLAAAGTFWLIFSLPLAYAASRVHVEWFFPAMLLVIGGRYLTFHVLFGERLYWACGLVLAIAGFGLGRLMAEPALAAATGALVEAGFAFAIGLRERRMPTPVPRAA